ncbi:MAG: class I SAM-dependent methyltransferase [Longimicrobiales bacterium]
MASINVHSPEWIRTFLDTVAPEQTAREVAFLGRMLPLFTHARVLDVCCGDGRHARPLALAGYAMTGIDANAVLIQRARVRWHEDDANAFGADDGADPRAPVFHVHDMRAMHDFEDGFDAVTCMWSSFGLFDGATNADVLLQMARRVRPGGRVVLDLYNPDFFEAHQGVRQLERAGRTVREEKTCAAGMLIVRHHYDDGSESTFRWQLFSPAALADVARAADLNVALLCARFDPNTAPAPDEPRMQVVLERVNP